MEQKVFKEIRFLKIYAIVTTLAFVALFGFSFTKPEKDDVTVFKEISAQRINIVSPQGKLRMVLSNAELQTPGKMDGVQLTDRERQQGIIFFNKDEDEVGGLVFDNGGLVLSVDKWKRDQIMQLQYFEGENEAAKYGLQFWDQGGDLGFIKRIAIRDSLTKLNYDDNKIEEILTSMNGRLLMPQRMFVGKSTKDEIGLFIKDKLGNNRIRIYVDKDGRARFQAYDRDGKSIPFNHLY
ncbi:hypothetical protein [Sphingobacterium faecale]|uniref:WG repeat protein n=1 Tax=Sphingobacterium faecale TaxID=2803775 RepID=A0ABS1R5G1_9SPHI|nr:hypothetical protein [Sphingobacterium faecale]MBL1409951.1 hypothetical protein [Sphingobacterium faecale]